MGFFGGQKKRTPRHRRHQGNPTAPVDTSPASEPLAPRESSAPAEQPLQTLPNRYADTPVAADAYPSCTCMTPKGHANDGARSWSDMHFHRDPPYADRRSWDIACEIIDGCIQTGATSLVLGQVMDHDDYMKLNTLPASIGDAKDLEELILYGSNISYLPRQLEYCDRLRRFVPYTSYRLHWFPYEMTRCPQLVSSTISTRALYGNYKFRPPFPNLSEPFEWPDEESWCSICGAREEELTQYWVSLRVGSDVVPLLASVCSTDCLRSIPTPSPDYIRHAHRGGNHLEQPD